MDADQTVSTQTYVDSPGSGTTPFALGSAVGRFVIRDRLGTGGMGEVYRAEDTQLKRTVAIKRLIASAEDPGHATRLLKEAQRASALNHTHIAGVYDVVTIGNELLLVMEYVDGVTLRERMKRDLDVSDFCSIALQCTDALSAAHRSGILHGDLKPANIMLTADGRVKVCDFGLARRLPKSDGAAETTTTTQHGIAGTPAYLSPEAILEQQVDERADVFSLGVVFYQMLARRHPFVADGVMATLDRVLHAAPAPLDRINHQVPARLARTIQRMIEKDPRDRYASAAEVHEAISAVAIRHAHAQRRRTLVRRVQIAVTAVAVSLLAVLGVPWLAGLASRMALPALPQQINLVILPFAAAGADGGNAFAVGLTESLSEHLSRLTINRPLQVVTEADRRSREVTSALQARQQFGANVAFRGSLQYSRGRVAVSAALLDIKIGQTLRDATFEIDGTDPITIESRVLEAATWMLNSQPTPLERARLGPGTRNAPARARYLEGRAHLLDDRPESVERAIDSFNQALQSDHDYALAYAALGQAFWRKRATTHSAVLVHPARAQCDSALAIDEELADAFVCLATVLNGTGEYERAAVEYRRAVDLDPTSDVAHAGLAAAYENLKKHPEAEKAYRRAIEIRPHYWRGYFTLGSYYYRWNRFDDALEQFQQVVKLAPESFRGHNNVGAARFSLGQITEAIDAFAMSRSIEPNYNAASNLGTLYYFEGDFERAAGFFREALALEGNRWDIWGNLAHIYEHLGLRRQAAEAFSRARELVLQELRVNPRDASLYVELADHHAALGDMGRARQALSDALQLGPQDAQTLFRIAVFYEIRMQRRDDALSWLRQAIERGQAWHEIESAPELKDLRADQRFAELRTLKTSQ